MKKFFYILFAIIFMASCESDIPQLPLPENDMAEISFDFLCDGVSIKEQSLSRAIAPNAKTYYAVQIESFNSDRYETGYVPYANGLFTDKTKMRIALPKGNRYRFSACVVEEREDTIFHVGKAYDMPFCSGYLYSDVLENGRNALLNNDFVIDNKFSMEFNKYHNQTSVSTGEQLQRCDKYVGEVEMEVNSASQISIPMERYTFGILYNIAPPVDGKVSVCIPGIKGANTKIDKEIYAVSAGEQQKEQQVLYNIPQSGKLELIIRWDRDDTNKDSYRIEKPISVENNKNYRLDINLNNRDGESSFDIQCSKEFTSTERIVVN